MNAINKMSDEGLLYFGYGSNLDEQDWARFCQARGFDGTCLEPVGPAVLPDQELVFDYFSPSRGGGALNLQSRVGQVVEGYLFRLSKAGWRALDRKEGVPSYYERMRAAALLPDGREVPVVTYRACAERVTTFQKPSAEYLQICRRGRERFGLGTAMLEAVAEGREAELRVPGVFAYGTLMRDEARHGLVEEIGLERMQPASVSARLHDCGQWPALSLSAADDGRWVKGELLVPADLELLLTQLDRIEGFRGFGQAGSLFRRTLAEVCVDGTEDPQRAWTYVMDEAPQHGEQIPGGCWRAHRGANHPPKSRGAPTLYWVQDDECVPAETPEQLVEYLSNTSMMPVESTAAFRERAAYWVKALFGAKVRTATDVEFVEDMIRAGAYRAERSH